MTEPVDHAHEARKIMSVMPNGIQAAQVHATLALAEQRRLASIIAWTTANGSEPSESIAKIIEEGLGL